MSFDLAAWYPHVRMSNADAAEFYGRLCEENTDGVMPYLQLGSADHQSE